MAWTNKRKIHVARGTTNNILNISGEANKFTDGQPLFNKDRGYLGIAAGMQDAKNIVPVKVREVAGWANELDSNGVYTLNGAQDGYYSFGSSKDGKVHLATQNDFILEKAIKPNQGNTYTFSTIFEYIVQNNKLNFNVPIETNNDIKITGDNKKIQATNAQFSNLKDSSGKTAVVLRSSWDILFENYNNDISGLWSTNTGVLLGSTATSAGVIIGELTPASGLTAAKSLLYSGNRTMLLGDTDIQGTNYIGGKTTIGYGKKVFVNGEFVDDSTDKLTINIPVELASSATLSAGNVLLSNNSISGISTLTASTVLCSNVGNSSTKPIINAGTTSVTSLNSSGPISGTSGTFSGTLTVNGTGTHTFKGDINASGKTITCGTLNVNEINFTLV